MNFSLLTRWKASLPVPVTKVTEQSSGTDTLDAYRVVLFNDEVHSFDEVIQQIIKATQPTESRTCYLGSPHPRPKHRLFRSHEQLPES